MWNDNWRRYIVFRNMGQGERCETCASLDARRVCAATDAERAEVSGDCECWWLCSVPCIQHLDDQELNAGHTLALFVLCQGGLEGLCICIISKRSQSLVIPI